MAKLMLGPPRRYSVSKGILYASNRAHPPLGIRPAHLGRNSKAPKSGLEADRSSGNVTCLRERLEQARSATRKTRLLACVSPPTVQPLLKTAVKMRLSWQ